MANPFATEFSVTKKLLAWAERAAKHGLELSTDLQPSIDRPEEMQRLVRVIRRASHLAPGPVYDARTVNHLFCLRYTEAQILAFGPPPGLPGFLTFLDPGWGLLRLRNFCHDKGAIFSRQEWYVFEAFAKKMEEPRYRNIRMEAVAGSFDKHSTIQWCLLPETEEVPPLRAVAMGMVIHYLLTGQRLFEYCHVRCASSALDGRRVNIGYFDSGGFDVGRCWDNDRDAGLGIASARKS